MKLDITLIIHSDTLPQGTYTKDQAREILKGKQLAWKGISAFAWALCPELTVIIKPNGSKTSSNLNQQNVSKELQNNGKLYDILAIPDDINAAPITTHDLTIEQVLKAFPGIKSEQIAELNGLNIDEAVLVDKTGGLDYEIKRTK